MELDRRHDAFLRNAPIMTVFLEPTFEAPSGMSSPFIFNLFGRNVSVTSVPSRHIRYLSSSSASTRCGRTIELGCGNWSSTNRHVTST